MIQLLTANNQNFDNGSNNGWSSGANNTGAAVSTTHAHSASYSLFLTSAASGTCVFWGPATTIAPYATVILSAWAYSTSAYTARLQADVKLSGTYVSTIFFGFSLPANTWTLATSPFIMPNTGNQITPIVGFTATASAQSIYWDDISILSRQSAIHTTLGVG